MYKKYYPIKTEADKRRILEEARCELLKIANRNVEFYSISEMVARKKYVQNMKDPIRRDGSINISRYYKNEAIVMEMKHDMELKKIIDYVRSVGETSELVILGISLAEYDKISIDSINKTIKTYHVNRVNIYKRFYIAIVLFIILGLIFYYNTKIN